MARKTLPHQYDSSRHPLMIGPLAAPTPVVASQMPIARARPVRVARSGSDRREVVTEGTHHEAADGRCPPRAAERPARPDNYHS